MKPSGKLSDSQAHLLNYPTFSTSQRRNGETGDLSNVCTRIAAQAMGGLDNALWIDRTQYRFSHQQKIGSPTKFSMRLEAHGWIRGYVEERAGKVWTTLLPWSKFPLERAYRNAFPSSKPFRFQGQLLFGERTHGHLECHEPDGPCEKAVCSLWRLSLPGDSSCISMVGNEASRQVESSILVRICSHCVTL